MAEGKAGTRLAAILWFVAGGLAWLAVVVRYARRDEVSWAWAAAGLLFLIMGFAALKRSRATDAAPRPGADTER
jgi:TRAP-type C4-dicarboxylate transport system permease small subunit